MLAPPRKRQGDVELREVLDEPLVLPAACGPQWCNGNGVVATLFVGQDPEPLAHEVDLVLWDPILHGAQHSGLDTAYDDVTRIEEGGGSRDVDNLRPILNHVRPRSCPSDHVLVSEPPIPVVILTPMAVADDEQHKEPMRAELKLPDGLPTAKRPWETSGEDRWYVIAARPPLELRQGALDSEVQLRLHIPDLHNGPLLYVVQGPPLGRVWFKETHNRVQGLRVDPHAR
mmetsp:Transcript_115021/g.245658  ORF Transcript_115021/g.245658 Transcript_115021/m.245658 type:complete len:229 (+) Transcript_115021:643-1329(+)